MKTVWRTWLLAVMAMSALSCSSGVEQACYTLSGQVLVTNTDVPLEGVTLEVTHPERGHVFEMKSDAQGMYTCPDLWEGTYTVHARKTGCSFFPATVTVKIDKSNASHIDFLGTLTWKKRFKETSWCKAYSIVNTSDYGFIYTGYIIDEENMDADVWVVKVDMFGDIVWEKKFGGDGFDIGHTVIETTDNGYLVAGSTESYGAGLADMWVLKLDTDGELEWDFVYGGSEWDEARTVVENSNHGFIIGGSTASFSASDENMLSDGILLQIRYDVAAQDVVVDWEQKYGGDAFDEIYTLRLLHDNGLIAGGFTELAGNGLTEFWVLRLDNNGDMDSTDCWETHFAYNDALYNEVHSIELASDGGFIVAGHTQRVSSDPGDAVICKLDSNGTEEWCSLYGSDLKDRLNSIVRTSDGGYLATGSRWDEASESIDCWIFKIDSQGDICWEKIYEGGLQDTDEGYCIKQSFDGGYIFAGSVTAVQGNDTVLLLKLNENGDIIDEAH